MNSLNEINDRDNTNYNYELWRQKSKQTSKDLKDITKQANQRLRQESLSERKVRRIKKGEPRFAVTAKQERITKELNDAYSEATKIY